MIAYIEGSVLHSTARSLIIELSDMGYEVFVPQPLIQTTKVGDVVSLWIRTVVREDAFDLYGFETLDEKEFFDLLRGVSGIGPRSALSILSIASIETLKQAVAAGDTTHLVKVSGIGKKSAEKIVVELRDKLTHVGYGKEGAAHLAGDVEALDALIALGYSQEEARTALKALNPDIIKTTERVKAALKELA